MHFLTIYYTSGIVVGAWGKAVKKRVNNVCLSSQDLQPGEDEVRETDNKQTSKVYLKLKYDNFL